MAYLAVVATVMAPRVYVDCRAESAADEHQDYGWDSQHAQVFKYLIQGPVVRHDVTVKSADAPYDIVYQHEQGEFEQAEPDKGVAVVFLAKVGRRRHREKDVRDIYHAYLQGGDDLHAAADAYIVGRGDGHRQGDVESDIRTAGEMQFLVVYLPPHDGYIHGRANQGEKQKGVGDVE